MFFCRSEIESLLPLVIFLSLLFLGFMELTTSKIKKILPIITFDFVFDIIMEGGGGLLINYMQKMQFFPFLSLQIFNCNS